MKVIKQYVELIEPIDKKGILSKIESAGRTCYKSENLIKEGSDALFVQRIIKSGHESVIEHASISVRIITDRGVTHELVRHRIASYSQESSRYCNYSADKFGNELTFIEPIFDDKHKFNREDFMNQWKKSMQQIEDTYINLSKDGVIAEYTRGLLPNSIKTEIVATLNLRSWRNFLKLRLNKAAHPQIRDIANQILDIFKNELPEVFGDLVDTEQAKETKEDFLKGTEEEQTKLCSNPKFDKLQVSEIRKGFENGLTVEQIKIFADTKFNWQQMDEIRRGLEQGLSVEQVKIYANPEFDDWRMEQIRRGYRNGLTEEQIKVYNNPKFDNGQMFEIRVGLQKGLTAEQVNLYAKPEFHYLQMQEIRLGFQNGLTKGQVKLYADPQFNWKQMNKIRAGLLELFNKK